MKLIKLTLYLGIIPIVLSGCSNFHIQVFETKPISADILTTGENFVFENDSIKLTYSFWGDKGVLTYSLENKLDKPIYVDWKSSSFIVNGKKFDYWEEKIISNTVTTGSSTELTYRIPYNHYTVSVSAQGFESRSNSVTEKPEKSTFIPPHSYTEKMTFLIYPYDYFDLNCNSTKTEMESSRDNPKKKTKVYATNFEEKNSPIKFRNYLSFSFSEDGSKAFHLDNGFYVSGIKEVSRKYFRGKRVGRVDGNPSYETPMINMKNFYVEILFPRDNFNRRNKCK